MAGITMSPQLRESPDTANDQLCVDCALVTMEARIENRATAVSMRMNESFWPDDSQEWH
jgi:hypothetical protein